MHTSTAMKCVRCDYSLEGLPVEYVCPECGLPFDKRLPVWRPGITKKIVGQLVVLVLYCAYTTMIYRMSSVRSVGDVFGKALVMVLCVSFGAWWGISIWRLYRRGELLAVSPTGVFIRDVFRLKFVPWSNISRVEPDRSRPGAHLFIIDMRTVRDLYGFFKDKEDAYQFVAAAREQMHQAAAASSRELEIEN
jgi:hypothetical protein